MLEAFAFRSEEYRCVYVLVSQIKRSERMEEGRKVWKWDS